MKIDLKRYPVRKNETLQAWDSADELLLQQLQQMDLTGKKILIMNDQFGALSCNLQEHDITAYTDSYLSFTGIQLNTQGKVLPLSQLKELSGPYDLVLIRIPKNMSYFEDMLCHLTQHLHAQSQVICGYMIKHQAKTSFDLLNRIIGETRTSLAQKKARLIFATFQKSSQVSPYPLQVKLEDSDVQWVNHSNVFSREKLDIGTRFFLSHIPSGSSSRILDLGCGNGMIGIAAKRLNPKAHLIFSDESQMAILSAKANYKRFFQDEADFLLDAL